MPPYQHDDLYSISSDSVSYFTQQAPTKKIKRKHVTFHENVTCVMVMHHNDYTDDEKRVCWYTQTEWRAMRHTVKEAVSAMLKELEMDGSTEENVDPRTPKKRMAPPLVTHRKALRKEEMLSFDKNAFYHHRNDATTAVCMSTASTNKCRAREHLTLAVGKIKNPQHQLVAIHDFAVNKRPEIGHALGMVMSSCD